MPNAIVTKGSTFKIGTAQTDVKAQLIEDVDLVIAEGSTETITASDGTRYPFVGVPDGDNTVELALLATTDVFSHVMDTGYGTGVAVSGGTEWDMTTSGTVGATANMVIETPVAADGLGLTYTAVNAKGVVIKPKMKLKDGVELRLKLICDYWKSKIST